MISSVYFVNILLLLLRIWHFFRTVDAPIPEILPKLLEPEQILLCLEVFFLKKTFFVNLKLFISYFFSKECLLVMTSPEEKLLRGMGKNTSNFMVWALPLLCKNTKVCTSFLFVYISYQLLVYILNNNYLFPFLPRWSCWISCLRRKNCGSSL